MNTGAAHLLNLRALIIERLMLGVDMALGMPDISTLCGINVTSDGNVAFGVSHNGSPVNQASSASVKRP